MGHDHEGTFEQGQRVRLRSQGLPEYATVRLALERAEGGWSLFIVDDAGGLHELVVPAGESAVATILKSDGGAGSARVLAGMWTRWMAAAATNAESTLLASTPLEPYAHQATAVYGAMLPQPFLRFLLADEPGTGKTIMAGLYTRRAALVLGTPMPPTTARSPTRPGGLLACWPRSQFEWVVGTTTSTLAP